MTIREPISPKSAPLTRADRTTWDSARPDCRILAMRKYARWPGLPTDLEPSRATG
jgi:hypothetical protein